MFEIVKFRFKMESFDADPESNPVVEFHTRPFGTSTVRLVLASMANGRFEKEAVNRTETASVTSAVLNHAAGTPGPPTYPFALNPNLLLADSPQQRME